MVRTKLPQSVLLTASEASSRRATELDLIAHAVRESHSWNGNLTNTGQNRPLVKNITSRIARFGTILLSIGLLAGCAPPIKSQGHPLLNMRVSEVTLDRAEPGRVGERLSFPIDGEVTLVYFWGSFCPPCKKKIPELEEIYKKFIDRPVKFVGVSIDMDLENAVQVTDEMDLTFPIVWDENEQARLAFGIGNEAPRLFLVDKHGKIRLFFKGKASKPEDEHARLGMLTRAIDSMLDAP